jgi:hypothetical protein
MGKKKVNIAYIVLKIIMFVLIAFFATDAIMQFISYSFYKGDRQLKEVAYEPVEIHINESLYGYGYNMDVEDDKVILFFGGSMYIAYNTVGMYGGAFDCPFLSVDYYGTQKSKGKSLLRFSRAYANIFLWTDKLYLAVKMMRRFPRQNRMSNLT